MFPIKISRTATLLLNDWNSLLKHISERVFPHFKANYYYKNLPSKATSSNLIRMKSVSESLGQLCSMISISIIGKWFELRERVQIPQSICGGVRGDGGSSRQRFACGLTHFPKERTRETSAKRGEKWLAWTPLSINNLKPCDNTE